MTAIPATQADAQAASQLRVLVIDDEAPFAKAVARKLGKEGHACEVAGTLSEARARLRSFDPDLALLDLRLPDGSGLDFLADLNDAPQARDTAVIVITAFGELADAVSAMKQGAADYLKKPIDLDELIIAIDKVMATIKLKHRLDYSREREGHQLDALEMIGACAAMKRMREQVERLARIDSDPTQPAPTVLILGETGTGKDLVARLLHRWGPRADRPFVQVDCASLPRDLIEAELFGHEKGAFTSAYAARAGLIEAAEDGVVFLDEIGELPLDLQAKLLNVIERRKLRRIGSVRERDVRARFVAGTNRDLAKAIEQGSFRADLYYRLNVVSLALPPLRERGEDVLALAKHYAHAASRRYRLREPEFDADARQAMLAYAWPGNVRELKHLIERAVLLCDGRSISGADLGLDAHAPVAVAAGGFPLAGLTLDAAEKLLIELALKETRGNVSEAARRLGVSRMAMRYRMERHGLKPGADG